MTEVPTLQFECKKDALRQMQEGHWKIQLTVHPNDMPSELLSAAMGQRFVAVLAAIGDDEQPVKLEAKPEPAEPTPGQRAVKRAVMLCRDPAFIKWVRDQFVAEDDGEANARLFITHNCRIASRRDLAVDPAAVERFEALETSFRYREQTR